MKFGAIIFCRTFKNYFDQFVWIEKSHYNSRVSLHEAPTEKGVTIIVAFHFMKRRLKILSILDDLGFFWIGAISICQTKIFSL